jgi:serine/threonine-protein kinase
VVGVLVIAGGYLAFGARKSPAPASGVESAKLAAAVLPVTPEPGEVRTVPAPAAPTPPAPEAAPPAPASATTLWVRVTPWAQVFLDGDLLGMTPLQPVRVTPGHHNLILVNGPLHVRKKFPVDVRPHERRVLKLDLASPPSDSNR